MAGFSNAVEQDILNCYFNQGNITAPTAIYLSLHTGDPGETGANEHGATGSYARINVTSSFPANSGGGSISNDTEIIGPQATADWTTVTHWGLWDASTSGNFLLGGSLTAGVTVTNGGKIDFGVGDLTFTLD